MRSYYEDQFGEIFQSESLRGERIHWTINWALYAVLLFLGAFVYFYQHNIVGKFGAILAVINLLYNLLLTWFIVKKRSVYYMSYITMFLNVLSITIYNVIDASSNSPVIPATTAALLLYPVTIFMASLRMDKSLIIWTSVLSILSMDGVYAWFYTSFDPVMVSGKMSIDIPSQAYRTVYLIMISYLIYTVPRSIRRMLKKQEQLAIENHENKQKAQRDSLTSLYNRQYFEQYLEQSLQTAREFHYKTALLFIDLDGFKELNDTSGHDAGDFVLKSVAEDLVSEIREMDLAARLGGDEFVVVMARFHELEEVEAFSNRILTTLLRPRQYNGMELHTSASIGVAVFPDDEENVPKLIKCADEAMYQVKRAGKGRICFNNGKSLGPEGSQMASL